jgi:hypothetical protein
MDIGYHVEALAQDASDYFGYLSGLANIATVRSELEKLQNKGLDVSNLKQKTDQLHTYFQELKQANIDVEPIVAREQFDGELLSEFDLFATKLHLCALLLRR